jgi:acyl-CoA synthetase (AMP-forming)/AMP-acid ligase II
MKEAYFADVDSIAPGDSIIHAAPMSHGSGLYVLPHIANGACHVVPESGGFDPDELFRLLRAHRGVTFFFAPTMVMRMIRAPAVREADLRNLKTLVYGGGPMYAEDSVAALECWSRRWITARALMTITRLAREAHLRVTSAPARRKPFTGIACACDEDDRALRKARWARRWARRRVMKAIGVTRRDRRNPARRLATPAICAFDDLAT